MTKTYQDEEVILTRTARATGTKVMLVWNGSADPDQPWETICDAHGGVCSHQYRYLAEAWLSHPDEWCEECMYGPGAFDGAVIHDPTAPTTEGAS